MSGDYPTYLVAAAALAVLTAAIQPTVRRALGRGATCLTCYPDAWRVPALFGLVYGLFRAAAALLVLVRGEESLWSWANDFDQRFPLPTASTILDWSWRSALDTTGSTFHIFTLTFPVSALFAVRFLLNVDGIFGALLRAFRRRLPRSGTLLLLGLGLSALAALAKPFVILLLPELTALFPQRAVLVGGAFVNYASLPFELLLGFFLLTYFLLVARLWRRGSKLNHRELIHLSCRRMGYVSKWAVVFLIAAFAIVILPNVAANTLDLPILKTYLIDWAPPIFATFLFTTVLIPITLTFRNLSLAAATASALQFFTANAAAVVSFLAFATISNLLLVGAGIFLNAVFGPDSIAALGGRCGLAIAAGVLAGWLVVSWACLYESRIPSRLQEID